MGCCSSSISHERKVHELDHIGKLCCKLLDSTIETCEVPDIEDTDRFLKDRHKNLIKLSEHFTIDDFKAFLSYKDELCVMYAHYSSCEPNHRHKEMIRQLKFDFDFKDTQKLLEKIRDKYFEEGKMLANSFPESTNCYKQGFYPEQKELFPREEEHALVSLDE